MSALRIYRDDGPLAAWIAGRLVLGGGPSAQPHRLAWLVPPLLRGVEYGSLIALAALTQPDALPACFALLVVLALHHYDTAYRLRAGRPPPPAWVGAAGAGWEGRLLLAGGLALAGWLRPGLLVAAVVLGVVYAAESVAGWVRAGEAARRPAPPGDDEDVLE